MDDSWTLTELVGEVAARIARLPEPRNGQVRALPDERTVRYYGTIGLLDRPGATRGRTALYGPRHLAQVVAIKRLQVAGRSLAAITAMWPTMDDVTLQRMSGVDLPRAARKPAATRDAFWRGAPATPGPDVAPPSPSPSPSPSPGAELRIELAPNVHITIAMPEDGVAISPADIRAIRAAAASLVTELAQRRLTKGEGP